MKLLDVLICNRRILVVGIEAILAMWQRPEFILAVKEKIFHLAVTWSKLESCRIIKENERGGGK